MTPCDTPPYDIRFTYVYRDEPTKNQPIGERNMRRTANPGVRQSFSFFFLSPRTTGNKARLSIGTVSSCVNNLIKRENFYEINGCGIRNTNNHRF